VILASARRSHLSYCTSIHLAARNLTRSQHIRSSRTVARREARPGV
jgi:hypothetical protein